MISDQILSVYVILLKNVKVIEKLRGIEQEEYFVLLLTC